MFKILLNFVLIFLFIKQYLLIYAVINIIHKIVLFNYI